MESNVLETYNRLMREQDAIFDEVLYEADLVAREQYVVRTAVEAAEKRAEKRAEERNTLQIASNLKRDNIPLDVIMRNTGLPLEVIKSL